MTGKEGQTAKSSSQDNYEATVLDFLDREMSAVQPSQKPKEYSEELDELVTDLLKQVINEADQKKPVQNAGVESLDDLIAELTPVSDGKTSAAKADSASQSRLNADKAATLPETPKPAEVESSAAGKSPRKDGQKPSGSLFASPAINKHKIPVVAVAFAGLLLVAGGAFYFFSNSAGSESKQSVAQSAATQTPALAGASNAQQTQSQPAAQQAQSNTAPSPNKAVKAEPSKQAAASAPKSAKVSDTKTESAPVASAKSSRDHEIRAQEPPAGSAAFTPAPPKIENTAQPVSAPPVVSNETEPVERPAAPIVAESAKQPEAVAERKTAPVIPSAPKPVPAAPVSAESSTPPPQPNTPAAVRNASPAVPITRANPKFPELALRSRASGTVVLDVTIDSQGKVTKATPVSGPVVFHPEAIKAAMKWRYKPASIDGTNVPSQNRITFNFNLKQ